MSLNRNEFLNSVWIKYPAMPTDSGGIAGFVVEKDLSGFQIVLKKNSQLQKINLIDYQVIGLQTFSAKAFLEILAVGDSVWLDIAEKKIQLLTPRQGELSTTSVHLQKNLYHWSLFLQEVRNFFNSQSFLEVQTPTLVSCPGTEPFLDVFETEFKMGQKYQKLYLPTSPEIHLKKMLAQGFEQIFEIKPCFRNGEISSRHQPEFYMLEWYRAFDRIESIQKDVIQLIQHLQNRLSFIKNKLPDKVSIHSMSELFKTYCGFTLTPQTTYDELNLLSQKLGLSVLVSDTWDDLFYRIYIEKIETQLGSDALFINKYPPSQAALARLTEEGWGDRFEFFWQGLEIANAFHELNDPQIQRKRSQEDLHYKTQIGKEPVELDEDFFRALETGMPPSGGIALGLERLFMALTGETQIENLKPFPLRY